MLFIIPLPVILLVTTPFLWNKTKYMKTFNAKHAFLMKDYEKAREYNALCLTIDPELEIGIQLQKVLEN